MSGLENEIWHPVKEYELYYQVSNLGRVRSIDRDTKNLKYGKISKGIILSQNTHHKNKYMSVMFKVMGNHKRLTVHSLVANAFLENINNLPEVNHKDGNKSNNHVDNLEWVSKSENCNHAIITGLRKATKVLAIKEMALMEFPSASHCARYIKTEVGWVIKRLDSNKEVKGFMLYSI